jgi:hypothetical protein
MLFEHLFGALQPHSCPIVFGRRPRVYLGLVRAVLRTSIIRRRVKRTVTAILEGPRIVEKWKR